MFIFIFLSDCAGLRCSMWDLIPWIGMELRPSALGLWSLNHWTTKEAPPPALSIPESLRVLFLLCSLLFPTFSLHDVKVRSHGVRCTWAPSTPRGRLEAFRHSSLLGKKHVASLRIYSLFSWMFAYIPYFVIVKRRKSPGRNSCSK